MNPKEKAKELVDKFYQAQVKILAKNGTSPIDLVEHEIAKQCALIAVAVEEILNNQISHSGAEYYSPEKDEIMCDGVYWLQVKTEIENL